MFGAYVRENRKVVIALAVYTAVFAFIFWLYRLQRPHGQARDRHRPVSLPPHP